MRCGRACFLAILPHCFLAIELHGPSPTPSCALPALPRSQRYSDPNSPRVAPNSPTVHATLQRSTDLVPNTIDQVVCVSAVLAARARARCDAAMLRDPILAGVAR